jgi:hypothetical protein
MTLTGQNCIHEEIKNNLNSQNACYSLVKNLLPSFSSLRNLEIKIYETIILPVVLYRSEAWSLTKRRNIE